MKTYAIGDIHGCLTALESLITMISPQKGDHLIFLGDYVDRGANSKGVIDALLTLSETHKCVFLMGNHEEKMILSRKYDFEYSEWIKHWDAEATMKSYRTDHIHEIPETHWEFLRTLTSTYETEAFLFVHANIEPDLPLSKQNGYTLTHKKLNPETASPHYSGKTVILGHTAQRSYLPLDLGHTICLDTDAGRQGWLTCLCLETRNYWQAKESGKTRTGTL